MKKLFNKKGFTLTEMIVVIAIIGILAGVLIPTVVGYIRRARVSADEQSAAGMDDVLQAYITDNNLGGNKASFEANDVRSIVLAADPTASFEPKVDGYSYIYDSIEQKIYYAKYEKATGEKQDVRRLEDIYDNGQLILDTDGSELARVVYGIRSMTSTADFAKITKTGNRTDYGKATRKIDGLALHLANFSPSESLYITTAGSFGQKSNPYAILFSDDIKILSRAQFDGVVTVDKLVLPASILYVCKDTFTATEINSKQFNNPNMVIETGSFTAETAAKLRIEEKDIADTKINSITTTLIYDAINQLNDDNAQVFTDGMFTHKYTAIKKMTFERNAQLKSESKGAALSISSVGDVVQYTYIEYSGTEVTTKSSFSFLRKLSINEISETAKTAKFSGNNAVIEEDPEDPTKHYYVATDALYARDTVGFELDLASLNLYYENIKVEVSYKEDKDAVGDPIVTELTEDNGVYKFYTPFDIKEVADDAQEVLTPAEILELNTDISQQKTLFEKIMTTGAFSVIITDLGATEEATDDKVVYILSYTK